jgi:hypothetical protein
VTRASTWKRSFSHRGMQHGADPALHRQHVVQRADSAERCRLSSCDAALRQARQQHPITWKLVATGLVDAGVDVET